MTNPAAGLNSENKRTCFVIAPIGTPDSEVRQLSDRVLRHVIRPAATESGYDALRADEIAEPGIITSQVIEHLIDDPMVLADLTGPNPNVFYELAIRHALRRPYVQIITIGERIPFDVAAVRTVEYDIHDLDSVEEAKAEIARQMKSMQKPDVLVDSPVTVAINLQAIREGSGPAQSQLTEVVAAIAELRSAVEYTRYSSDRAASEIKLVAERLAEGIGRAPSDPKLAIGLIWQLQSIKVAFDQWGRQQAGLPPEAESEINEIRNGLSRAILMAERLSFEPDGPPQPNIQVPPPRSRRVRATRTGESDPG